MEFENGLFTLYGRMEPTTDNVPPGALYAGPTVRAADDGRRPVRGPGVRPSQVSVGLAPVPAAGPAQSLRHGQLPPLARRVGGLT